MCFAHKALPVLTLFLLIGCSNNEQTPEKPSAPVTADAMPGGLPLVLQALTGRVTTNVDSKPNFVFRIPPKYGPPGEYATLIASRSRYVGSDGRIVAVEVEVQDGKLQDPGLGSRIALLPVDPLESNAWYHLSISLSPAELNIQGEGIQKQSTGSWNLPFFTGSAPHVASALVTVKSPLVLHIEFSEPMELGTIAPPEFAQQGKIAISKCLMIGTACTEATSVAMESANFQLKQPIDFTKSLDLILPLSAVGAGAKVGESSAAAGYQPEISGSGLVTSIGTGLWTECHNGGAKCWTWPGKMPSK